MRIGFLATGAVMATGLGLAIFSGDATATPLPSLILSQAAPSTVQTVDWRRRYWRRNGVWPTAPAPIIENDVVIETDDGEIVVVPLRPASCGQFHYWNGRACVDARYNDPYLGPK